MHANTRSSEASLQARYLRHHSAQQPAAAIRLLRSALRLGAATAPPLQHAATPRAAAAEAGSRDAFVYMLSGTARSRLPPLAAPGGALGGPHTEPQAVQEEASGRTTSILLPMDGHNNRALLLLQNGCVAPRRKGTSQQRPTKHKRTYTPPPNPCPMQERGRRHQMLNPRCLGRRADPIQIPMLCNCTAPTHARSSAVAHPAWWIVHLNKNPSATQPQRPASAQPTNRPIPAVHPAADKARGTNHLTWRESSKSPAIIQKTPGALQRAGGAPAMHGQRGGWSHKCQRRHTTSARIVPAARHAAQPQASMRAAGCTSACPFKPAHPTHFKKRAPAPAHSRLGQGAL